MHVTEEHGHLVAVVRPLDDMPPVNVSDPSFVALHKELRARSAELGQKSGLPEEVVQQVLNGIDDPGRFSDLVAGYLDLDTAQRQELLETLAVDDRLRRVLVHVQRQIAVLDAQEDIKSQVQEELGERQREVYLREQLKTIRRELGDEDEAGEMDELEQRLIKLELAARGAQGSRSRARRGFAAPAANRWKRRSFAPTSSTSPSCRGTTAPTSGST